MKEATVRVEPVLTGDVQPVIGRRPEARNVQRLAALEHWSPERFAREQIRGLVRRVFLSGGARAAKQVAFSGIDRWTEIDAICSQVGEVLADEQPGDVAVVGGRARSNVRSDAGGRRPENDEAHDGHPYGEDSEIHRRANLWFLPANAGNNWGSKTAIQTYLQDIRREFRYSIVQGPPAIEGDEAAVIGQSTDGLILVLSAQHTRRVSAVRIREMLADAELRLLGTVLSDREFPIPEKIYRCL
jgi:hypothetical protein